METQYEKRKSFIVNTIYILLILAIAYVTLKYVAPLISPFIFAFIIAFILKKPANFIAVKTRLPRKFVSFFLVLLFYSTIGVLFTFTGIKIISTVSGIVSALPAFYENQLSPLLLTTFDAIEKAVLRIDPALVETFNEGFETFINSQGENVTKVSMAAVGSLSGFASSLPSFLIKTLLMIISTFFIAIDFELFTTFMRNQFSLKNNEVIKTIKEYVTNTLFVVMRSYALIMSITFVELSIGLSIIGIQNAIVIAFFIAMFDILPVLGTGGIMIPWTIMTFIQGDFNTGIGLLVVYVVITIVRNIIEPKIVGGQLGIHPVVALLSMFVGANLLGVVGLFGFPITLSLIKHLNKTGIIKIFK